MTDYNRRSFIALATLGVTLPRVSHALSAREITWDDLIPAGVPYAEIIGEGEIDILNDTWNPIFDENAKKLNTDLNGAYIRMPGFIVPLEFDEHGVSEFILVPYMGACIHVPPPPPNQLVLVHTQTPWAHNDLWQAIWVEGHMTTQLTTTDIAQTGYALHASHLEIYEW